MSSALPILGFSLQGSALKGCKHQHELATANRNQSSPNKPTKTNNLNLYSLFVFGLCAFGPRAATHRIQYAVYII